MSSEEREKEYKDLREIQSKLTKEGYALYEKMRNSEQYVNCPEYIRLYQHSKKIYNGASKTYTREALGILKQVNFDKNFKPVTKEDLEKA